METKKCPYCGKTVLAISKACKHCGESFEQEQPDVEEILNSTVEIETQTRSDSYHQEETQTIDDSSNKGMFKAPFSFQGRIRRLEYGLSYIIYLIWYIILKSMDLTYDVSGFTIFWCILAIPIIWFLFAQGSKRCHDRNNSGWYQLIPFYGLWMIFASGDEDENYYGMSPK